MEGVDLQAIIVLKKVAKIIHGLLAKKTTMNQEIHELNDLLKIKRKTINQEFCVCELKGNGHQNKTMNQEIHELEVH